MEALYMHKLGEKGRAAEIGDVVIVDSLRCIVIAVNGTFVKVLGIAIRKETGDTVVLTPRYIHEFPASQCMYLEKQTLNL